nr:transposase (putative), gypsy type [Tanacetum cinerariifolium]
MSFNKRPGKNTPQCYSKPLDSLKNCNNRFFWVDECVFPPAVEWRTNASKDGMPTSGTYSVEAVRVLDTHRTPIQKQPEALLCLVGIRRRYYLGDDVYPTFHYDDDREMDIFSLIRAPNPTKVKTGSRPRAPHELPLLTLIASRVIEMDEPAAATDSSGVPSAIEKSPLDFADEAEASSQETAAPEVPPPEEVPISTVSGGDQAAPVAVEPPTVQESRKRGARGLMLMRPRSVPADVSDPDLLAFADAPSPHHADVIRSSQGVAAAGDPAAGIWRGDPKGRGGDAPQFIHDLRPSSSQLAIPVYPEVRDPRNPWACTEEIKLADAIAANISRAEQKKRSRIVCRTHGVGSAHHARSDRVPVSAPIVVPQGLALILVDAATQTDPDA